MHSPRSTARFVLSLGLASVAFAAIGCADEAPPFAEGQGQAPTPDEAWVEDSYPAGPYGIEKGSVVQNFKFIGFNQPHLDKNGLAEIKMSDFYNPTGSDVYPEGHPRVGQPKPKALLIAVSAVWCGPCQYENAEILPGEYAKYGPQGAEFLLQLADGPTQGVPAEARHLVSWTTKYKTAWPAVIDPAYKLGALFEADAYPANILIDTRTMKIVESLAGVPEAGSSFFVSLEALLE